MPDEYTPTTEEVIDGYTQMRARDLGGDPLRRVLTAVDGLAEFDRWLAAYEAEGRERIAQDIEAEASRARHQTWMGGPDRSMAVGDGLDEAARIARGASR